MLNTEYGSNVTVLYAKKCRMKDTVLIDLFTHWETLRAGRAAPKRSELDPRALRDILHHTFILEYQNKGDFRFRLAGAEICEVLGMELRAMPARAVIDPVDRGKFDAALEQVVSDGNILELRAAFPNGQEARMLFLPMMDEIGTITRVVGAIVGRTPDLRAPARMTIIDCIFKRVVLGEELDAKSAFAGFADPATPFEHGRDYGPLSPSERPYLKLVRPKDT